MRSKTTRTIAIVAAAILLVTAGAVLAPADEPGVSIAVDAPEARVITGESDHVAHGSAWVGEREWRFKKIFHRGWGTQFKKKAPGDEWVHISVPWTSRLDGTWLNVRLVQFCAASTNGTVTKPIRVDVWENNTRIVQQAIAWPADNNYHCVDVNIAPSVFAESIGVSVLVHFENKADRVTFYKAWAISEP